MFYRTSVTRVTTGDSIEVLGEESSGEVEFVLLQHAQELWLGVGSDHTDRKVETYDVGVSKQMCEKPIAPTWWAFRDVADRAFTTTPFVHDHWEEVYLMSGDLSVGSDARGSGGDLFEAPTYACRPLGAYHGPFSSKTGCLLFEIHYYDESGR